MSIYIDTITEKSTSTITINPGTVQKHTPNTKQRRGVEISNNTAGDVYVRTASVNATALTTATSVNCEILIPTKSFVALGYGSTIALYFDGAEAGSVVVSEVWT